MWVDFGGDGSRLGSGLCENRKIVTRGWLYHFLGLLVCGIHDYVL